MAATEEKDLEKTIAEDLVVTKYKLAGEIVNSKCLQSYSFTPLYFDTCSGMKYRNVSVLSLQ